MDKTVYLVEKGSATSPQGFQACGIRCGLKQKGKDLALVTSEKPAVIAAMFTTNRVQAAPVILSRRRAAAGIAQALIINSGNANACTGEQGYADALEMTALAAEDLSINPDHVLVASTGIIGVPMPMEIIRRGIKDACACLSRTGGEEAAHAIMTTDTRPKNFAVRFELDGKSCCIGAMAKGSGMINPHVATMICVITTDVHISAELLGQALAESMEDSINALTIDGEMSTNDAVFLFANGMSGNELIKAKGRQYENFLSALRSITKAAAEALAEDGEGATHLVRVTVENARNREEAVVAAKAIANSLLVKTAIFGRDPNWGRVASAAGASGVTLDPQAIEIRLAGIPVATKGGAIPFDATVMNKALEDKEIDICIGLGVGRYSATVLTCDLTKEYISINADYHT